MRIPQPGEAFRTASRVAGGEIDGVEINE